MKLSIIFKCKEASHICDKSQYRESSLWERTLMRLHQVICKVCREHSATNSRLSALIDKAHLETLPETTRREIKTKIKRELSR